MTSDTAFASEPAVWNPPQSPQSSPVTVTAISVETDWTREASTLIDRLRTLQANWDGYNSPAIEGAAIESAYQLIRSMSRHSLSAPSIAPVTGGGIALEFVSLPRVLELEVLPNGAVEFLCVEKRQGSSNIVDEGQLSIPRVYEASYLAGWLLSDQDSQ